MNYKNKKLTIYEKRCQDCICLIEKNNQYYCNECQQYCNKIKNCPEGLETIVTNKN